MDDEKIKKRAEELSKMSTEEFIRDRELRRQERKRALDPLVRKWFGTTFEEKFTNADDVWKGLCDNEPNIRRLALFAALGPWRHAVDTERFSLVEKMALTDPDTDVRSAALVVLGALYYGSCDTRIATLLADVVRNDAEKPDCRSSAYSGLLDLLGQHRDIETIELPAIVDWDLVYKFVNGGG